jgi:hypothetical protein
MSELETKSRRKLLSETPIPSSRFACNALSHSAILRLRFRNRHRMVSKPCGTTIIWHILNSFVIILGHLQCRVRSLPTLTSSRKQ